MTARRRPAARPSATGSGSDTVVDNDDEPALTVKYVPVALLYIAQYGAALFAGSSKLPIDAAVGDSLTVNSSKPALIGSVGSTIKLPLATWPRLGSGTATETGKGAGSECSVSLPSAPASCFRRPSQRQRQRPLQPPRQVSTSTASSWPSTRCSPVNEDEDFRPGAVACCGEAWRLPVVRT